MEQARICIAYASAFLGTVSFVLYFIDAWISLRTKPKAIEASGDAAKAAAAAADAQPAGGPVAEGVPNLADLSALTDSLAKLAEALQKAGPALTSLIGAVLFYAIAAIAGGALQSAPEASTTAQTPQSTPAPKGPDTKKPDAMPTPKPKLPSPPAH